MNSTNLNPNPPPALSLWATLRLFPRAAWVLFAGTFINKFGTFVLPFLALHLTRQGYSATQAGLGLAAYGAGALAASLLGGHLADSIGRRNTIVLSTFSGAVAMLALSQVTSLPLVLAVAFFTGLTADFYKPASSALLADLVAPEHRVTAYAAYRFFINAGWALGPTIGGFLAGKSYFWLFVGDAATAAAFGLVALVFLPREPQRAAVGGRPPSGAGASLAEGVRAALGDPRFVRILLATLAIGLVFLQVFTTLGLEVQAAGFDESIYGRILAVNGLLVVLLEVPLSAYLRRLPPRRVIAVGFALIGVGAGLNAAAQSPAGYALAMAVLTAGEITSISVSLAYVASLAPEAMRGRFLGIYGLTWSTAIAGGPALGLWVFSRSPEGLWLGCVLLGALASAIVAGWVPWPRRQSLSAAARAQPPSLMPPDTRCG